MRKRVSLFLVIGFVFSFIGGVSAQESCDSPQQLDRYRFLRRLSLDMREQVPTLEEYESLDGETDVPDSLIDEWLTSPGYLSSMRHHHDSLLWPNPSEGQLFANEYRLITQQGAAVPESEKLYRIFSVGRIKTYRGSPSLSCKNVPQSSFGYDADGRPLYEVIDAGGPGEQDDIRQEGYEWINPYWAPDTQIRVCAFDAQAFEVGINGANCGVFEISGTDGASRPAADPGCGCGPNLRWCYGPPVQAEIWEEMYQQFGEMVDWVTSGDKPYTDLILGTSVPMNGRLHYWKRHMAALVSPNRTINNHTAGEPALVDNPDYMDLTWTEVDVSAYRVGVQTLPAFMLRFQTNRARANRFRIVFTGQYFIPPEQPEDPQVEDCLEDTADVTEQCTCRYCHQVLEPLAQYWGNFFEAGSVQNDALSVYVSYCDPKEYGPGGDFEGVPLDKMPPLCSGFYATSEEAQNPGWLYAYQHIFLEGDAKHNNEGLDDPLHKSMTDNLFKGPVGYAEEVIESGQFATATVKHLFRRLMKRELNLDPTDPKNETVLLSEWSESFRGDWAYDFPTLFKAMVQHPIYRRVR